jgi:hypothetical protein
MGEFPSKKHWQNCYGTFEEDFLEIDAIIGDIIFLWVRCAWKEKKAANATDWEKPFEGIPSE